MFCTVVISFLMTNNTFDCDMAYTSISKFLCKGFVPETCSFQLIHFLRWFFFLDLDVTLIFSTWFYLDGLIKVQCLLFPLHCEENTGLVLEKFHWYNAFPGVFYIFICGIQYILIDFKLYYCTIFVIMVGFKLHIFYPAFHF